MKPIKLKELLRTAKDPATQRIVIDEGLWFDAPLFEGVVKDVDEALGERIILRFLAVHHLCKPKN